MLHHLRRRTRRTISALAAAISVALVLTACGSGGSVATADAEVGDPVHGGTVRIVQGGEPRSLDPATLVNAWVSNSLIGNALYGTLLVNFAKTSLSESFPQLWLFGLGALFIAVVLAFPNGLAGIWRDHVQTRLDRLMSSRKPKGDWANSSVADGAPAE